MMKKFNINKTKTLVEKLTNINLPVLLNGPTGIGKTSIIEEIAVENKFKFIDFRLATELPENIAGIPSKKDEKRFTRLLYDKLEPAFKQKCLIFFDEFNRSNKWVRNSVMSLIFERRIGEEELNEETRIIAAVNYGSNYRDTERLDDAVIARFAIVNIEGDYETLLNYLFQKRSKGYLVFSAIRDVYGRKFEEKTSVEIITPVTAGRTVDYAAMLIDAYWDDPDLPDLLYTVLPPEDVEIVLRASNFELISKILRGEKVEDISEDKLNMIIAFVSDLELSDEEFMNLVDFLGQFYDEIGGQERMAALLQTMIKSKRNSEVTMRNLKEVLRRFSDLRNVPSLP